jgi:hypothetical protein
MPHCVFPGAWHLIAGTCRQALRNVLGLHPVRRGNMKMRNQLSGPACQWVHDLFIAKWCSFLDVCLVCRKLPSQKLVSKFVCWIFDVASAELPRSVFQYDVILCICNILDLPTLKKKCLFRLLSNRFYRVTQKSGDWPRCIPVCIVCWLVFTHGRFVIDESGRTLWLSIQEVSLQIVWVAQALLCTKKTDSKTLQIDPKSLKRTKNQQTVIVLVQLRRGWFLLTQ